MRFLPAFLFHTMRSRSQLRRSSGFIAGYTATGPKFTFWTVTVWRDHDSMKRYRRSGAHLKAMPKLLDWCDEAAVASFVEQSGIPPKPAEAARRLLADGRISKVLNPSAPHARGELWPDNMVPQAGPTIRPA